ncbi:MAG TPA: succinate dehydrogenase, hydrophobic membrane anchor protein [Leucothrix mucor]|uniref:Succinate dehydrogenase hydrophobic membrane anchor subunit n=1 Tax=Leucothrix mucor TaxID=45248 RepID=A0A7V2WVR7_LEUMU|nr:succinate dehydrogenase, hydrophobic membrane anchor protein [Leucothrix mucor]
MKDLRSPLAKVKGLGKFPDATHHFWIQRLTSLALIPLTLWFCFSIALLPEASHAAVIAWLQFPFNTVMMILVVLIAFHHAQLGLQVILEDYIAHYGSRLAMILAIKFTSYFMMALGVYSILKIALGDA